MADQRRQPVAVNGPQQGMPRQAPVDVQARSNIDAIESEGQLLNQANGWRPIIPAMDEAEVNSHVDFWQYQMQRPLTPRAKQTAEEMIRSLEGRRETIRSGAQATVDQNYDQMLPGGGQANPLAGDPAGLIDEMVNGPYRSPRR